MANANTLTLPAESGQWSLPSRRKVGVIGLILTENALFTIFVVAYVFYIGKSATGPYPNDVLELPILATICLLSSSVTSSWRSTLFDGGIMEDSDSGGRSLFSSRWRSWAPPLSNGGD